MAIFPFSTKGSKPEDKALVLEVKAYCSRRHLVFSSVVVDLLRKYKEEVIEKHNNGQI